MSAGENSGEVPPAREQFDEINTIPDLNVGDTVRVETAANYAPDRTLTVEEIGTEAQSGDILAFRGDDDGYVLSGYGTEYHLITTGTPHWQRVDIVFQSCPTGQSVSNIEILDRGDGTEAET
jgi:hypothetical protein